MKGRPSPRGGQSERGSRRRSFHHFGRASLDDWGRGKGGKRQARSLAPSRRLWLRDRDTSFGHSGCFLRGGRERLRRCAVVWLASLSAVALLEGVLPGIAQAAARRRCPAAAGLQPSAHAHPHVVRVRKALAQHEWGDRSAVFAHLAIEVPARREELGELAPRSRLGAVPRAGGEARAGQMARGAPNHESWCG